nr:DUF885 domain-containing protein [uncultured Blautia sp.]
MRLFLRRHRKKLLLMLSLCLVFLTGTGIGRLAGHGGEENRKFEAFTEKIFEKEVSGNMLNLHYSLAHPEKKGISRPAPTLGTVASDPEKTFALYEDYLKQLKEFSPSRLSRDNQITLDMLLLYFHTQLSIKNCTLLEELLSPSLGIQAQLPVLLAEYAFYEDQDISDYLNLLSSIEPYFQSILEFEKEKSKAGLFMSDTTLNRIQKQCQAFIQDPDSNYMQEVFARKIKDYKKFSKKNQQKLILTHEKILKNKVLPAYQSLIQGLEDLRGTGVSSRGLAHYPNGRKYYEYLIKSQTGSYTPVPQIQKRLFTQLSADLKLMKQFLTEQPSLLLKLQKDTKLLIQEPSAILKALEISIKKDFPAPGNVSYEVHNVHESMEEYLSPAFYLTPPLDTRTPNVIYINQAGRPSGSELFSTLAHEGFPGHLYQTVYFASTKPSDIRYLISFGGYVEGWATYAESCIPSYAKDFLDDSAAADVASLYWINRSMNLCIYSLMDMGVHYHGWTKNQADQFLRTFGITDPSVTGEIYQYIVETPANYLKYYWGYLNFLDLRSRQQKKLGENFQLSDFHKKVLETGPVPFPVLEKYMN